MMKIKKTVFIGGSQEFKDDFSFGLSNSNLIITKLDLKGNIVWNKVIKEIRTLADVTFSHSLLTIDQNAFLLYVDEKTNNYKINETKLARINLINGNIETQLISKNKKTHSNQVNNYYFNKDNSTLYFTKSNNNKVTINRVSLE